MRDRVLDALFGGVIGGLTGAVVALNILAFSGMEQGYATSISEAFQENSVVGYLVVAVLAAGPITGIAVARRMRRRSDTPVIVEADSRHIPAIAAFFREAWTMTGPDAPGWAGASQEAIDHLTRPDVLAARIGGPDRRMFLARQGKRVVGFAATRVDGATAELAGIVVLQDLLGRGIGTPLLDAAIGRLRSDGIGRVIVKTEASNDRALSFYRARGFGSERRVSEVVEGEMMELIELDHQIDPSPTR